ncbi:hypothetical protein F5148DRAFT_1177674 [Russula earlei]|uniref:Uncharacterized protein n=1 Tax=Russula earlei TaxID=71964 RepID=A0ACC0UGB0_9AGAM|nr:hypothetical protein F5148DRAFT_1177674 [Russula earlei]
MDSPRLPDGQTFEEWQSYRRRQRRRIQRAPEISPSRRAAVDIPTASGPGVGHVSPLEYTSTALAEKLLEPNPVTSVDPPSHVSQLPVGRSDSSEYERQLPVETSSQPERETFMAPRLFPYIFEKIKVRSIKAGNASSSCKTNLRPSNMEHRHGLSSSSGTMEDRSSNPSERVQPAPASSLTERPILPTRKPALTGANGAKDRDTASIDVPLPPHCDVGYSTTIETVPSNHYATKRNNECQSGEFIGYDTGDESCTCLPPSTTSIENTANHGQTHPPRSYTIPASQYEDPVGHARKPRFNDFEWQEFVLPDDTRYFSHSTLDIITDVDLRNAERLDAVTGFLNQRDAEILPPPEWELWLRDPDVSTTGFTMHIAWIHHGERMVVFKHPASDSGGRHLCRDDHYAVTDSEYQYWLFMGSHPVHALLPSESVSDAIDVLTCFYTTRDECQELLAQLRSFGYMSEQTVSFARTRVVSTALSRVFEWKLGRHRDGATFQGLRNNHAQSAGIPILRAVEDLILSDVSWNDHVIKVSARQVGYIISLVLLALCMSLPRLLL